MTLLLDQPTIDAIADRVAEKLIAAQPKPVMSPRAAMAYAGLKSLAAFYRWCESNHVRPLDRGRYSRRRLDVALGIGGSQ